MLRRLSTYRNLVRALSKRPRLGRGFASPINRSLPTSISSITRSFHYKSTRTQRGGDGLKDSTAQTQVTGFTNLKSSVKPSHDVVSRIQEESDLLGDNILIGLQQVGALVSPAGIWYLTTTLNNPALEDLQDFPYGFENPLFRSLQDAGYSEDSFDLEDEWFESVERAVNLWFEMFENDLCRRRVIGMRVVNKIEEIGWERWSDGLDHHWIEDHSQDCEGTKVMD